MKIASAPRMRAMALIGLLLLLLLPGEALAAGGALAPLVHDIGVSLLVAGLLAVLFHRFRIPSIAAFLVAGFIVGPGGGALVQDLENIPVIAEFGLVLLLFVIGLELDFRKIISSGRIIIVTGLLQYPLSILVGFMLAKLLAFMGVTALGGEFAPLYMGIVMAASSTLLVVKLFQESFELDTTAGRVSLGLLIFQDIWAIVIIALQPNFSNPQIGPIVSAFLGIALLTVITVVVARYILPAVFRWIATSPELILVGAVGWCFGIVFLGGNFDAFGETLFGINAHIAVGSGMSALIAGASIANLPFSRDVIGKVGVVKDFFVILFFVGLGMGIPVPDGVEVLLLALLFAFAAIVMRYIVFVPLLYFNGLDRRNAVVSSTRLAQLSEFSLIIVYAGYGLGHIDALFNSATIFAFVITALVTPVLYRYADDLYTRIQSLLDRLGLRSPKSDAEEKKEEYSLAVLGFHRLSSSLLYELQKKMPELLEQVLVVDFNVHLHDKIAALGPTTRYGDLANAETLHHAGVDRARVVLIAVQDDVLKGTSNLRLVNDIRHINPNAVIIANAIELPQSQELYDAGADYVYMSRVDSAQGLMEPLVSALDGYIDEYRVTRENCDGKWHERDEVIP
jgi:Kef-type K+ transport system membrane component KefB